MRTAALLLLLLAAPAGAETLVTQATERHVAIGDVAAHVFADGTAYAVRGTTVIPLTPSDVRIAAGRALVHLPDGFRSCPLPLDALDDERDLLRQRTGRTLRVMTRRHLQTWVTVCPDGDGVIWTVTERTVLYTRDP